MEVDPNPNTPWEKTATEFPEIKRADMIWLAIFPSMFRKSPSMMAAHAPRSVRVDKAHKRSGAFEIPSDSRWSFNSERSG
ncbi:hypothetical protein BDS110ZK4_84040 [Bradyrhizobium diazoefficiens]